MVFIEHRYPRRKELEFGAFQGVVIVLLLLFGFFLFLLDDEVVLE